MSFLCSNLFSSCLLCCFLLLSNFFIFLSLNFRFFHGSLQILLFFFLKRFLSSSFFCRHSFLVLVFFSFVLQVPLV